MNDYILKTKNSTIEAYFIPLYFLVRLIKPEKIVETGVHRGVSSLFILQALHDNNKGKLYSIDLPMSEYKQDNSDMTKSTLPIEKIGTCVPKNLRSRWELIFGDSKEKLPKLLQELLKKDRDAFDIYKKLLDLRYYNELSFDNSVARYIEFLEL